MGHFLDVFVATEAVKPKIDIFPSGFVPKPHQTRSPALSQHEIKTFNMKKDKVSTYQWFVKCKCPTFQLLRLQFTFL